MMSKKNIFIALSVLVVLVAAGSAVWYFLNSRDTDNSTQVSEEDLAAAQQKQYEDAKTTTIDDAKRIYAQLKNAGLNMTNGPCLSNGKEWVVDVVHNPRQESDNSPSNQCPNYVSGTATHFVELDPDGNLVRAQ